MKRSEMVDYIKTFMDEDLGRIVDIIEADYVLTRLEEKGMLPPPKNGRVKIEEKDGQLFIPLFGWEDEKSKG